MVTCRSANQLKTPAKVSWAFKMVSQFGSLVYTIMGKTADLTVVQKTIIHTLHKEGKPQTLPKKLAVHRVLYPSMSTESWVEGKSVLPGLRRRRTELLPSGPKSSFQMRASFVFHLETKVLESGGRVEKLISQVAWSPVWSFQSVMIWVQCHLLVLVHCVFWKPTSLHTFTKTFWSTSCFLLLTSFLKMLILFYNGIWHLPTLPKAPKVG